MEHLALHSFGLADYHYNGVTGVEYTYFHMQGTAQEIVDFLTGVCAALRSLPMAPARRREGDPAYRGRTAAGRA